MLVFVSKMNLSRIMFILQVIVHILIRKPTRCTKSIFGIKLHVSDSSSVHRQEFFTVHTAMYMS